MKMRTLRGLMPLPACLLGIALWAGSAQAAAPESFKVPLSGAEQVPPVKTHGTGVADFTYDPATRELGWFITYRGLTGPVTMAHLHGPATRGGTAEVQIWVTMQGRAVASPIRGHTKLTPEQAKELAAGELYLNLHTQAYPAGEIRGQVQLPKG